MSDNKDIWVVGLTDDINKHYVLGQNIGQPGQYGRACVATKINPAPGEPQQYAVKIISKARFRARSANTRERLFQSFRDEVSLMASMDHPNIIKFYEAFESKTDFYIVMQLCTGGELFDRITARGTYTERDAVVVMRQLFTAIDYMHRVKKVAHCDLKPDNCIFLNPSENAPLEVIDFGMAKILKHRKYFKEFAGTPYYVAPEVLDGKYNEAADVWSLGVVMFVLLFGYPPFQVDYNTYGAYADQKIFDLIRAGFKPVKRPGYGPFFPETIPVSPAAYDLISKILVADFAERPSAQEVLEHPWMTGSASNNPVAPSVLSSIKTFQHSSKFKIKILEVMSQTLSQNETDQLKRSFIAMDLNKDGTITIEELKKAFEIIGKHEDWANLQKMVDAADIDRDGRISYHELTLTNVQRKLNAKEERLWNAFNFFDKNNDGIITADEMQAALRNNNESDVNDLIRAADKNGDGKIDYEEFLRAWADSSVKHIEQVAADLPNPRGNQKAGANDSSAGPPTKNDSCCTIL